MDHVQIIIDTLKGAGIIAYRIAESTGTVKRPYVVVHDQGVAAQTRMTGQQVYELVCLAPRSDQAAIYTLMAETKKAMGKVPRYVFTGDQAPTGIEREFDGISQSLIYRMPRRLQ